MVIWEDFIDALSQTRLQDEYNKAIRECDLFVMLFSSKVGKYTAEEFATAFGHFKETNKPRIYTYFKDAPLTTATAKKDDLTSLWDFQEKLRSLGHFQTQYQNTEGLLLQFGQQLDKLMENGFIQPDINVEQQAAQDQNTIPRLLTAPPFIPEIFEGREPDLEAVHQKLFGSEQLLLLVNGEGGIGKTTLAAKYWQRYQNEYRHMAWVFAQSGLADALLTLVLPLHVEFPANMAAKQRLNHLLAAMANLDKPCLLVIDNANDRDDLENNYPALRTCSNFKLLLTTSVTQFGQAQTYRIEALNEADALSVFTKHYAKHRPEQDDLFRSIREAVAGNTLVLELLAKNLAAINTDEVFYSLADLLEDLKTKGLLQLSQTGTVTLPTKDRLTLNQVNPTAVIATLYDEMETNAPLSAAEQQLLSNLAVLPTEPALYLAQDPADPGRCKAIFQHANQFRPARLAGES